MAVVGGPQLDPNSDVRFSQKALWESEVVHLYNDNYMGIRSACASLPGRKLVLPNVGWNYEEHLQVVIDFVEACGVDRIVFHGMSNAIFESIQAISRHNTVSRIFGVWHGSPSQWVDELEALQFERFLKFDRSGVTTKSHILRRGADGILLRRPARDLLNAPPLRTEREHGWREGVAIVPATPSIYKNVYGNLLAAELSPAIVECRHYADLRSTPVSLFKAKQIEYLGLDGHHRQLQNAQVVLNAGLMECHSMVDLEALVVGRFSIHARSPKEDFIEHEYLAFSTVEDPGSIDEVTTAIERAVRIPFDRCRGICQDFARVLAKESQIRWEEFLDF